MVRASPGKSERFQPLIFEILAETFSILQDQAFAAQ